MRNWLQNQYVVLSGASGGIGKALVQLLIRDYGAKVIGIGRSKEKMLALQNELGADSHAFSYHLFDVGIAQNWQDFRMELLSANIQPILLINNAGVFPALQKTLTSPSSTVEKTLQTNFLSTVYATEALSDILLKTGDHIPAIVNVSSSAALCPIVGAAAYAASKSALKAYTEALQLEVGKTKYIGVIYPGTTATDLFREDDNVKNSAMGMIAMPAPKMAKKIAKRILKHKKRSVLGWDAKLMNLTAKLLPIKGPALICKIMKLSKSVAFNNVFSVDESSMSNDSTSSTQ